MPIPESAAFIAKKPTVPPTFDGVDYNDTVALKKAQDAIIREQWVRSMMARLVRDEMGKCYRREGVNHFEKCSVYRDQFMISDRMLFVTAKPSQDPVFAQAKRKSDGVMTLEKDAVTFACNAAAVRDSFLPIKEGFKPERTPPTLRSLINRILVPV
ncbi:MAG: hypothetical protein Q9159_003328 [Coniocarpon cinnabarinum]